MLAVVILLIFLKAVGILSPLEALITRVLSPIEHFVYASGVKVNGLYSSFTGKDVLLSENSNLKDQLAALTVQNAQIQVELAELKEALIQHDFLDSRDLRAITVRVVGKNPQPDFQSIILDQGAKAGIRVGQPVIVKDGMLVGKIFKVNDYTSEALLLSDPRIRVAAEIQNNLKSRGVVVGEHGLSLKMELIPQNEIIEIDNLVITSGVEPTIPRGLVIGRVVRIESQSNALFHSAFVKPITDIENLLVVSVIE